jgi:hypothetical protein
MRTGTRRSSRMTGTCSGARAACVLSFGCDPVRFAPVLRSRTSAIPAPIPYNRTRTYTNEFSGLSRKLAWRARVAAPEQLRSEPIGEQQSEIEQSERAGIEGRQHRMRWISGEQHIQEW